MKQKIIVEPKIRDISYSKELHSVILGALLIAFNIFLILAAILLAVWIDLWYVWLLDVLIVGLCITRSIITFINRKHFSYSLYQNCILLNSLWYDNAIIEYKSIKRVKFKVGFMDRLFGKKTHTITMFLNDELQSKVNLYFIVEDPQKLIEEITRLSSLTFVPTEENGAD